MTFALNPLPNKTQRLAIAQTAQISERQVQIWFQNKRQRNKAAAAAKGETVDHLASLETLTDESPSDRQLAAFDFDMAVNDLPEDPFDADAFSLGQRATPAPPSPTSTATSSREEDEEGATSREEDELSSPAPTPLLGRAELDMAVFTEANPPYRVLWANQDWLDVCGFKQEEVAGQTLKVIQGPATPATGIASLMEAVQQRTPACVPLVNYTKEGVPFAHTVHVEPLVCASGTLRAFKSTSSDVTLLENARAVGGLAASSTSSASSQHSGDESP